MGIKVQLDDEDSGIASHGMAMLPKGVKEIKQANKELATLFEGSNFTIKKLEHSDSNKSAISIELVYSLDIGV